MNIMLFLRHIFFLCQKELISTFSDPRMRIQLILPVLLQGFLFGYAANYNLEDIPYAVVDDSHSSAARSFLASVEGSPAFSCAAAGMRMDDVTDALYNGDVLLIIAIPSDFDSQLEKGQAPVEVITDGRNPMIAGMASRYVTSIASTWSLQQTGGHLPITVKSRTWFNPNQLSRWMFLPSFLAMIAFVQVMFLAGLSIAREREQGTFDQLLVTPLSPTEILICKATPPVLVGLIQSMMLFLIVRFWFEVPFAGSFVTLFTSIFVFLVSTTGLGLSISSISRNMQQVLVYLLVLMMPMVLLSGLVTPVDNMPEILQLITWTDPMRFIVDAVRRIYLEGAGFGDIWFDFVPMLGVAAVTMPAAGWLFRHKAA